MTFSVSVMKKQSKNMVAKEKTASPKRRAKKQKRANIYRHRRQKPIGVPMQMFIVYAPGHFGNFPPSREASHLTLQRADPVPGPRILPFTEVCAKRLRTVCPCQGLQKYCRNSLSKAFGSGVIMSRFRRRRRAKDWRVRR